MLYGLDTLRFGGVDVACRGYLLNSLSEVVLVIDHGLKNSGDTSVLPNGSIVRFLFHDFCPFYSRTVIFTKNYSLTREKSKKKLFFYYESNSILLQVKVT
jgi:hypothetical protein